MKHYKCNLGFWLMNTFKRERDKREVEEEREKSQRFLFHIKSAGNPVPSKTLHIHKDSGLRQLMAPPAATSDHAAARKQRRGTDGRTDGRADKRASAECSFIAFSSHCHRNLNRANKESALLLLLLLFVLQPLVICTLKSRC